MFKLDYKNQSSGSCFFGWESPKAIPFSGLLKKANKYMVRYWSKDVKINSDHIVQTNTIIGNPPVHQSSMLQNRID